MKSGFSTLALAAVAAALVGCATTPETPVTKEPEKPAPKSEPEAATPQPGKIPDDGFRIGNLDQALPSDSDYRATHPGPTKAGPNSGAVIVAPPKPKPATPAVAE